MDPSKKTKKEEKRAQKALKLFQTATFKRYAFKLAYVGIDYLGLEGQPGIENTIEFHLFKAVQQLMLVPSIEAAKYKRAGRTDKGVSALGNVISLTLRCTGDNDHLSSINRLLPQDIRLLDMEECSEEFDARYDCIRRIYKYYFFREDLDIQLMQQAAQLYLGEHDFRNFCKMDVIANQNFIRTMYKVDIQPDGNRVPFLGEDPRMQLYCATIEGNAFIWHQIRCMMEVLFQIGKHRDEPEVITKLLDVQSCVGKPQYGLAPDQNLVLYDCQYPEDKLKFRGQQSEQFLIQYYNAMKKKLQNDFIRQFMYINMGLAAFGQRIEEIQQKAINEKKPPKKTQKIMEMNRGPTLEEIIGNLKGKRKEMYDVKMQKVQEYESKQQ